MGEMKNAFRIFVGTPEGTRLVDLGIDGRIILEQILGKEE
jgi:hypothetical protein